VSAQHRFGFRDPNGILDEAAEMSPNTRTSFFDCLEAIATEPDPEDDPEVMPLRDPRYPGALTRPFDEGIVVYTGPHHVPPLALIELVDALWLDEDEEDEDPDYP